jgi:hypothetical protein
MADYNLHDEEFRELLEKARSKIRDGDLPSNTDIPRSQPDRHQDYCRVCEQVIGLQELLWYQLEWYSKGRPDPHQRGPRKPELHAKCYAAWWNAARELEDAGQGQR